MSEKLESFLLLAKGTKGRALCDLVVKATGESGMYEFGELVELATAKEVSSEIGRSR